MNIVEQLKKEFQISEQSAKNTVNLIEDGNTIPFIARYRKELTQNMSDTTLREFDERYAYLKNLGQRKEEVIRLIEKQDLLTEELEKDIQQCTLLKDVEELYLPYKPKRRTKATIAKERGLMPLAAEILKQELSDSEIYKIASQYVKQEEIETPEDAVLGACDIIAEMISENVTYRNIARNLTLQYGAFVSSVKKEAAESDTVFTNYHDYREKISLIADHRVLAINRGESKKILKITIDAPQENIIDQINAHFIKNISSELLMQTVTDAYKRLIAPSIEREVRSTLTERADKSAITVFAANLKNLLLTPPVKDKVIMGFDPAYRTGCKIAVIDKYGTLLGYDTIYPTQPQNRIKESEKTILDFIDGYDVNIISIGNGTASRESEAFIAETIKQSTKPVQYIVVNEAGASVYSASELGAEEYPKLNVSIRGAVSIAQRLRDPLAELVKIDPKHIGVGQYQHDVNQKELAHALENVVEDTVNSVGVDVNTASSALLGYVAGISKKTAEAIRVYVTEKNGIRDRKELLKIKGLGAKAFEQCAGFLRIQNGENPLDNTGVHPESYNMTEKLLDIVGISLDQIFDENLSNKLDDIDVHDLSETLHIGEYTLQDIINELKKPGRDPREQLEPVAFKKEIMEMKDLEPGLKIRGTVRNITHFGAFIDIGVHQDGLVHISKLSERFVKDPFEVVRVGDIVDVTVMEVDLNRKRISLTMIPK